jgi:DNA repair exonuclease SbcCD ATPase subunit
MNEVYLSNINIQDFRTFGDFRLELPPAPGLLLLSGTNGLGKSSFFDAIEWALTGKIRRFTPYVSRQGKTVIPDKDYLTRNGAEPDSHAVTLEFSEGTSIRRSTSEEPSPGMVAALLARPGRGEITDLGTHLAMTHFLGQAERQRFTSREADDQWAALKGPSGVDRLELIRTRLRGRSTTNAFNNRVRANQTLIAEIEKEIADWHGWTARLERLRTAVRAGGGLTKEDICSRAEIIETEIAGITGLKVVGVSEETASQLLARLAGLLEMVAKQASERVVRLAGAPVLIERYESQAELAQSEHPNLVRAQQQLDDARKASADAQAKVSTSNDAVAAQSEMIASSDAEINRLEAARTDLIGQGDLIPMIEAARAELAAQNTALEEQRRLLSEADGVISMRAAAVAEMARLQGVAAQARVDLDMSNRIGELTAQARASQAILDEAVLAATEIKAEYDTAASQREQLWASIEAQRAELAEAERHAGAIAAAVASIASHVHDDDKACPVCQATYPAGELKLLANEAAHSGNARVAEISDRMEGLATQFAVLTQRSEKLSSVLARPALLEPDVSKARQEAADLVAALRQSLKAGESDDHISLAASRDSTAQSQLADAREKVTTQQPAVLAAEERRAAATSQIDQLATRVTAATTRLNGLLADERDRTERIAARGVPTPTASEIGTLLAARRDKLEAARKRLGELEGEAVANLATSKALEQQLRTREAELSVAKVAQKNAAQATQELIRQWNSLGLAGTPGRATLEVAQGTANKTSTDLALIGYTLKELSDVNQDLLLDEEVVIVTAQMRAAGGDDAVRDPETHLKTLQSRLPPARAALKLSQDAQDAINKYTVKLGERAAAYNREVLQPLNERILEFNAAMLSTPGASVQFKANKRVDRTDFEMQLEYSDQIESSLLGDRKVPPQVVLSEGQLAANGFSILCAASTAYRWSRWRTLLLDDPLQHNDIIHTAAFVDVMRNLVELQGYQLIMSSHDRAESDFIARKFDAAGLACTTVVLTAPSEAGVLYDSPSFNVPAGRVLSARFGTTTATSA